MNTNKQIQFKIDEPCSENWDMMTHVDTARRHCKSCDKVITDFSGMSDTEVMLWFKHSKGKVCGRFTPNQLNRAMTVPAEKSEKKKFWLNALWLIPFAWGSKEARAQSTTPLPVSTGQQPVTTATEIQAAEENKLKKISGTVKLIEEGKEITADCRVTLMDSSNTVIAETTADTAGFYTLNVPSDASEKLILCFYSPRAVGNTVVLNADQRATVHLVLDKEIEILPVSIYPVAGGISYHEVERRAPKEQSFWGKVRSAFTFGKK